MLNRSTWEAFALANEPTYNSSSSNGKSAEWVSKIKLGFNVVFLVVGLFSNVFVLILNAKIKKTRGQAPAYQYFISNLCVSELIFVLLTFFDIYYDMSFSLLYCKVVYPLPTMALIVSMYTVAAIALFRCRAIIHPFKPKPSAKCTYLTIAGLWFFALIDVIPYAIVLDSKNGSCKEAWWTQTLNKVYTIALFALQYPLPLAVLAVSYIKIVVFLKHHAIPNTSNLSINTASQMAVRRKRDMEILKMSVMIVMLYAVLTLPLQVAWIAHIFNHDSVLQRIVFQFSSQLLLLHSCCNPFVYGTISREFRSQAMSIMRDCSNGGVLRRNTTEAAVIFKGGRVNIALQNE